MFYFSLKSATLSFWTKLADWYYESVFHELLLYFEQTWFTVQFRTYENIPLDADSGAYARAIILAMALGVTVAAAMAAHTRRGLGRFVGALLREECHSPEKAKTLMELGFFGSDTVRRELSRGINLRRLVVRLDEECPVQSPSVEAEQGSVKAEEHSKADGADAASISSDAPLTAAQKARPDRIDFLTARFYIPEDLRHRAAIRFEAKGSGWGVVVGTVLVALVGAALLCRYLPDLVQLADNIISMMSPQ